MFAARRAGRGEGAGGGGAGGGTRGSAGAGSAGAPGSSVARGLPRGGVVAGAPRAPLTPKPRALAEQRASGGRPGQTLETGRAPDAPVNTARAPRHNLFPREPHFALDLERATGRLILSRTPDKTFCRRLVPGKWRPNRDLKERKHREKTLREPTRKWLSADLEARSHQKPAWTSVFRLLRDSPASPPPRSTARGWDRQTRTSTRFCRARMQIEHDRNGLSLLQNI
ncbi:uncharacterized protein LOC119254588 [Talpa occidentalis]|uniref:uncharacterized protein LOC119254588 n=1 Tax=Talpa occidentalis TaxID=50954 RepID=UPI0023F93B12|nr:uncharacterized protein LOC119254588 [Talpa occidentalis]